MPAEKPLVIYHANCRDGFTAAWVARRALGEDCEFFPAQYGQDPPDCTGREVYILDFSYKRPVMRQILSQAMKVTVLDHHKTAEAELEGLCDELVMSPELIANPPGSHLPVIWFNMTKSGARLAWEHFFPGIMTPQLVLYVEDRDLWKYDLPCSRNINAVIESMAMSWDTWDNLAGNLEHKATFHELVQQGDAIERYKQNLVDSICGNAQEVELAGHKILAANTTVLFSEVAGQLAEGRPFGAAWFYRQDGQKVWSLRSREGGVDVSEVARSFGGGGHRNAAGFQQAQNDQSR